MNNTPENEQISIIVATLPGALLALFGWFGRFLMKARPDQIIWVNVIGGLMVSAFTGLAIGLLAKSWGVPVELALALAGIGGAEGENGLKFVIKRFLKGD